MLNICRTSEKQVELFLCDSIKPVIIQTHIYRFHTSAQFLGIISFDSSDRTAGSTLTGAVITALKVLLAVKLNNHLFNTISKE